MNDQMDLCFCGYSKCLGPENAEKGGFKLCSKCGRHYSPYEEDDDTDDRLDSEYYLIYQFIDNTCMDCKLYIQEQEKSKNE